MRSLTPCHTNYFPENVPVLTIQFYSKSVHVLIKENTKIFFFFCFFLRSWWKKSFTLKGLTCERLRDVIVCQGVKKDKSGETVIPSKFMEVSVYVTLCPFAKMDTEKQNEKKREKEREGERDWKAEKGWLRLCRPIMKGLLDGRQENGAMKLGLPWPRYRDGPVSRNEKDAEKRQGWRSNDREQIILRTRWNYPLCSDVDCRAWGKMFIERAPIMQNAEAICTRDLAWFGKLVRKRRLFFCGRLLYILYTDRITFYTGCFREGDDSVWKKTSRIKEKFFREKIRVRKFIKNIYLI